MERFSATVFSKTYESRKYWFVLLFSQVVAGVIVGINSYSNRYDGMASSVVQLALSCANLTILCFLLLVNRHMRKKTRGVGALSFRYQISENVRVLRLLTPVVLLHTTTDLVGSTVFKVGFDFEEDKYIASIFCEAVLFLQFLLPKMDVLSHGNENVNAGDAAIESKKPRMDEQLLTIRFVKLNPEAQAPVYGSDAAAGADLRSVEDCVVPAHGKQCVSTGLQVELPFGYYGRVAPRSGLAAKNFIDVGGGVVDSDYRGELKVLLFNFGPSDFEIKKGDRIAQIVCERIAHCKYEECTTLTDTARGEGRFGSTGK